jgi:hypothetical protein
MMLFSHDQAFIEDLALFSTCLILFRNIFYNQGQ